MANFEEINLGRDDAGTGGDSYRGASSKTNRNFSTVARWLPGPVGYVVDSKVLTVDDVGKRIALLVDSAGKTVWLPQASAALADSTILLWNLRSPMTVAGQGTDNVDIGILQTGDWAMYAADGDKTWHVVMRGRNGWDEVVSGGLTVGGGVSAKGQLIGGVGSDEGEIRLGAAPGYFYASSTSAGYWSEKNGSFQLSFSDKKFRVDGVELQPKTAYRTVSLGYSESQNIPSNGSDKVAQIFGFGYTHPETGAGVLMLSALVRIAWLSGNPFFAAFDLRLFDTVTSATVAIESWGADFAAGDVGLYWAQSVTIPMSVVGLIPGRAYEVRLFAGKNSDGRCQIAMRGSGVAF